MSDVTKGQQPKNEPDKQSEPTYSADSHHKIEISPDQFEEFVRVGKRAVIKDVDNGRTVHVQQSAKVKFDTYWKIGTFIFMLLFVYWAVPLTRTVQADHAQITIGPRYTADQGKALEVRMAKFEQAVIRLEAKVDRDDRQEVRITAMETVIANIQTPPPWFEEMVRINTKQIGENAKMIERLAVAMEYHNRETIER